MAHLIYSAKIIFFWDTGCLFYTLSAYKTTKFVRFPLGVVRNSFGFRIGECKRKSWQVMIIRTTYANICCAFINLTAYQMAQERKLPLAEIKAGLKLTKEAYNVLASDTDYVKGIRYHLERVDAALQSGNLEMILYCNQQVVKDYRGFLVRNHVEVVHNPSVLREKGLCWNFFNLRVIGHLLANEIINDKLKDGAMAGIAIACEYFCNKTVDSRK